MVKDLARNSKSETRNKPKCSKIRKFQTQRYQISVLDFLAFWVYLVLSLFRISIFGFWILLMWSLGVIKSVKPFC